MLPFAFHTLNIENLQLPNILNCLQFFCLTDIVYCSLKICKLRLHYILYFTLYLHYKHYILYFIHLALIRQKNLKRVRLQMLNVLSTTGKEKSDIFIKKSLKNVSKPRHYYKTKKRFIRKVILYQHQMTYRDDLVSPFEIFYVIYSRKFFISFN